MLYKLVFLFVYALKKIPLHLCNFTTSMANPVDLSLLLNLMIVLEIYLFFLSRDTYVFVSITILLRRIL